MSPVTPTGGAATPGAAGTVALPGPAAAACGTGDLTVTLAVSGVGGAPPRAGAPVRLAAALGSTVTCRLTMGPGAVRLGVTSGADRVWDSARCPVATTGLGPVGQALLLPAQVTVPAAGTALVNVVWPAVRLGAGCTPAPTALRAGTYTADLQLPGAPPAVIAFQLR